MQDFELLEEGLTLMALGMGFVFVFLTILVLTTTLMSMLVRRLAPAPEAPAAAPPAPVSSAASPERPNDAETLAVISAALHRYRRRQRR